MEMFFTTYTTTDIHDVGTHSRLHLCILLGANIYSSKNFDEKLGDNVAVLFIVINISIRGWLSHFYI